LLEKDPKASAPVIAQHLKPLGFDGGLTIIKDYLRVLRKNSVARRAYVRVGPASGKRLAIFLGYYNSAEIVSASGAASSGFCRAI
jgi:hypothetical protein